MTSAVALQVPSVATRYVCPMCNATSLGHAVLLAPHCPACAVVLTPVGSWDLAHEAWPSWWTHEGGISV